MTLQETLKTRPAKVAFADLVKRFQVVPSSLKTSFGFGVVLSQNSVLHRGLACFFAHHAEILAFELLGAALASDSDNLVDANVEKVF
jgi:hypothetical protein